MADADAVRGAGVPDRVPTPPDPGAPVPVVSGETVMTLVDHLTELRSRLIRCVLAVVVGGAVGFLFSKQIRDTLMSPLPAGHQTLQALGPGDGFAIALRIAIAVGIILAMPVLLYQLWAFVAPGLTPSEKRTLRPWIPLALFFFVLGVTVAWIFLPFAIQFLLAFTDDTTLIATLAAPPYFDFVTTMFLVFGLLMEFPIVLYAFARVGIVSSTRLRSSRRMVILGIAIFSAIATPGGDLVSPTVLGITMYVLFELTIIATGRSGR